MLVTLVTKDDGLEVGTTVPATGDSVVEDTVGDAVSVSVTGGGVGYKRNIIYKFGKKKYECKMIL